jgi:cardiolipin synthase
MLKTSFGAYGELDQRNNMTRGAASLESGAGLLGKTLIVDPLVRPVSTLKALYGATIKSAGGFLERTLIEKLRLPLLERKPLPGLSGAAPMELHAWELHLDDITGTTASSGSIRFLVDGEAYFNRLAEVIAAAEESIDIRSYIFDNDDVALEIADLLRARADGTEIRILVDGLADLFATRLDSSSMPDSVILPPSISDYLSYNSNIDFRKQSNPWFTGDHAKITIIDQELAFLGGMNIGREYRHDWHDLMMEIEGPVVQQLQFEFDLAWSKSGMLGDMGWFVRALKGYEVKNSEGFPIRVLSTTIHDSELYRAQVAAIRRARNYIYIENAYFSDDKILYELARARRRGVDVRVILPIEGDSGILDLSNQKTINTMLRNGIRVYSYPGMTHVKAAIYDGWACLGSANFDKLSLQINQEINLAFSDPEAVGQLMEKVFYPDFRLSTELHEALPLAGRHHFAELIADELF